MEVYKSVISPILGKLDSETWHVKARQALHVAEIVPGGLTTLGLLNYGGSKFGDPRLAVTLGKNCQPRFQVHLDNRTLVGGGWDKVGESVKAWHRLGAAGVVVGAVLPNPQPGNERPRQWYFEEYGVAMNRLGFNSPGQSRVLSNLYGYVGEYLNGEVKVGINVGINKDTTPAQAPEAYASVVRSLWPVANWFEINVSSPNTKDLRVLQDAIYLRDIIQAVNAAMDQRGGRRPAYPKIAPDLPRAGIDGVIKVICDESLSGVVACNTTVNEAIKSRYGVAGQLGGISGQDRDYQFMVNKIVAYIRQETKGVPIFEIQGVGGVNNTDAALEKFEAGADIVQVVTAIREVGPTVFGRINRGLANFMDTKGIRDSQQFQDDIIGGAIKKYHHWSINPL